MNGSFLDRVEHYYRNRTDRFLAPGERLRTGQCVKVIPTNGDQLLDARVLKLADSRGQLKVRVAGGTCRRVISVRRRNILVPR